MTKTILLAGILATGTLSANTIVVKAENEKKEIITDYVNAKSSEADAKKNVQCATFYASCTAAYTCQNWTMEQWYDWAAAIQQNYCQL